MHAMLISLVTLSQVFWYARRTKAAHETGEERNRLLPSAEGGSKLDITTPISPATPSVPCQIALAGIVIASLVSASLVWIGKTELLDWLYFASSMKLIISVIKYVPQVLLNWRIRSVEGFAIGQILLVSFPP